MLLRRVTNLFTNKAPVPYAPKAAGPFRVAKKQNDTVSGLQSYGQVSTLFAVVNRLANDTSASDWSLYRKKTDSRRRYAWDDMDSRQEVTEHAALTVLNKPNKFMTRQELFEVAEQFIELTGEAFIVVGYGKAFNIPTELWPINPRYMDVVPSVENFIEGYVYTTPEGQKIPFDTNEIIHLRMPSPLDPFRGMSPVTPLLVDLDSNRAAAEWNRNFFYNDATPGGMIEYQDMLTDDEFKTLKMRWNENHQGVGNSHKMGIIEKGRWVNTSISMRDMQFAELRQASSDRILEAFGFPKFKLGIVQDVNRANAEASEVMYARSLLVPRLERIKQALNNDFLPLFGITSNNLEFDYCSPVPEDQESENANLLNRVNVVKILSDAGFDKAAAMKMVGLPELEISGGVNNEQDMVRNQEPNGDSG